MKTRKKPGPKPVSVGTKMFSVLGILVADGMSNFVPRSLDEIYASLTRDYSDPSMCDLCPRTHRHMEHFLWNLKKQGYVDTVSGRRSYWVATSRGQQASLDACERMDETEIDSASQVCGLGYMQGRR
jgi:hypothetical protein